LGGQSWTVGTFVPEGSHVTDVSNPYSASEQGLGYIYQARFALLRLLTLPEDNAVLIEKDDDLDFLEEGGGKSLASLKHKAVGDKVTDLAIDFWKSVRVWLGAYNRDGRASSNLRFFLFTTGEVSGSSFTRYLLPEAETPESTVREQAEAVLATTKSELIQKVRDDLLDLSEDERDDFFGRITIVDKSPRITDVPAAVIDGHLRTIRREFRQPVFERLEGWWSDVVIRILSGDRTAAVSGFEVSDKLSSISEEYKSDNLPITFRDRQPTGVDIDTDDRPFVVQLRAIQLTPARLRSAIIDYYRAFEQRSSWARENLLVSGEVEEYEDRLVDEWQRYRDVVFEVLEPDSAEEALVTAGRELYRWAEFETVHIRIRERVSEPYVVRGAFHMLANTRPLPRVHWHPRFLETLAAALEVTA
jgi:hypothetical protein